MSTPKPPPHQRNRIFELALSDLLQPAKLQNSLDVLTLVDLISDYGPDQLDLSTRLRIVSALNNQSSAPFLGTWSTSTGAARLMNVWMEGAFSVTSTRFHAMRGELLELLGKLPLSGQLCLDKKLLEHLERVATAFPRSENDDVSGHALELLAKWRDYATSHSLNVKARPVGPARLSARASDEMRKRKQPPAPESNANTKRRQVMKSPSNETEPPPTDSDMPVSNEGDLLSLEEICDNLQPHEIVEFVEAAVRLVRAEQFQWRDGDQQSGMFILLALLLKTISTKPLYQHLLSLQGADAQVMLNSMQLLLDFPASLDPADRRSILKALLRLSNKSELYPHCLTLQRVERSTQALDEGSYGEVFRGRFENQNVALKVFKVRERSDVSKILKAVWKEAILWSQLSHDNLLPFYGVYHLGDQHNRVCLVSPWMERGNVVDYLKHNPRVERALLLADIASGIAYLHSHEIIHGDLKGANILVSDSGRACLADFGLSKVSDPVLLRWTSINTATAPGGTLRWQAPELFTPEDVGEVVVTTKSDIYSFACIMTGQIPFYQISQPYTVLMKVMSGARPSKPVPTDHAFLEFGLTDPLWELMEDCWRQEPDARPTAEEILANPVLASLIDRRPPQHFEGFSATQFRRAMTMLAGDS